MTLLKDIDNLIDEIKKFIKDSRIKKKFRRKSILN